MGCVAQLACGGKKMRMKLCDKANRTCGKSTDMGGWKAAQASKSHVKLTHIAKDGKAGEVKN